MKLLSLPLSPAAGQGLKSLQNQLLCTSCKNRKNGCMILLSRYPNEMQKLKSAFFPLTLRLNTFQLTKRKMEFPESLWYWKLGWSGLGGMEPRDVMLKPGWRVSWFTENSCISKSIIHIWKTVDLSVWTTDHSFSLFYWHLQIYEKCLLWH